MLPHVAFSMILHTFFYGRDQMLLRTIFLGFYTCPGFHTTFRWCAQKLEMVFYCNWSIESHFN